MKSSARIVFFAAITYALLVLAASAMADDLPDAPAPNMRSYGLPKREVSAHRFDKRVYFTGIALLGAAKAADAITTRQLLDRGGWENNHLQGRHPSAGRQAVFNLAFFAAQSGLFYVTEHNRHAWIRWTGRAWLGAVVVNHAQLASCNAGVNVHSAVEQNCKSIQPSAIF